MELLKEHFRHLLYFFNKKKTAADNHRKLVKTYREFSIIVLLSVNIFGFNSFSILEIYRLSIFNII